MKILRRKCSLESQSSGQPLSDRSTNSQQTLQLLKLWTLEVILEGTYCCSSSTVEACTLHGIVPLKSVLGYDV